MKRAAWRSLALALTLAGCAHVAPRRHVPPKPSRFLAEGLASYYGPGLWGHRTASGEVLVKGELTAAHRTLPFGTCLRVENLANHRQVEVRVNDRGPYVAGRILDVSEAAARALGMLQKGVARVRLYRCRREWR